MADGSHHAAGCSPDTLESALFALDSGRPEEAERVAAGLLEADPANAEAAYILGSALIVQGRSDAAVEPLEAAARDRDDPRLDTVLAIATAQCGRHEEARGLLQRVTEGHPTYAAAFRELGTVLVLMGQYDEAIEVLRRGIAIVPAMLQMSVQLGYAYLSRGGCADARAEFTRALAISPGSPDALYGMAKAHQEAGGNEEAATYFRRYLALWPNDRGAWLSLGHCLLECGQADAGHECFLQAARGGPANYGDALISLASAARGRLWHRPSEAAKFFHVSKSCSDVSAPGNAGDMRLPLD